MDGHLDGESSASFVQRIQSSAPEADYLLASPLPANVFARRGYRSFVPEGDVLRVFRVWQVKNVTTTRGEILAKARRCGLHDLIEV